MFTECLNLQKKRKRKGKGRRKREKKMKKKIKKKKKEILKSKLIIKIRKIYSYLYS